MSDSYARLCRRLADGASNSISQVWEVGGQLSGLVFSILVLRAVEASGHPTNVLWAWAACQVGCLSQRKRHWDRQKCGWQNMTFTAKLQTRVECAQAMHVGLRYKAMSLLQLPSLNQKRASTLVRAHAAGQPLPSALELCLHPLPRKTAAQILLNFRATARLCPAGITSCTTSPPQNMGVSCINIRAYHVSMPSCMQGQHNELTCESGTAGVKECNRSEVILLPPAAVSPSVEFGCAVDAACGDSQHGGAVPLAELHRVYAAERYMLAWRARRAHVLLRSDHNGRDLLKVRRAAYLQRSYGGST